MLRSSSGSREAILTRLRAGNGELLSGTTLARELGISRMAVWKRIEALRREGYGIEAVRRKGYRLVAEVDALTPDCVTPLLPDGLFRPDLYRFYGKTGSTNDLAVQLARGGAGEGTVVVADRQTQGRGRLGRVWSSPPGINLYFSLVLRPPLEPRFAAQLTLLAGLALGEAITLAGVSGITIKWPNDLLLGGRKLGGILTEMDAEPDRVRFVVVGVGVNVNGDEKSFPAELRDQAVSLLTVDGRRFQRATLLASFLKVFEKWYHCYRQEGFAPVRQGWLAMARIQGRRVEVNLLRERFIGRALDMDGDGFLLVEREDGVVSRVVAGDVTLLEPK
ncbi:MAG: biotin--[acetyl-CoA-carboxylase] ligase [Magnetococcales bacterium]|nr:biotin--[acetyl-CoA-carboxylase] ligase [Magnetococcales bacterium]